MSPNDILDRTNKALEKSFDHWYTGLSLNRQSVLVQEIVLLAAAERCPVEDAVLRVRERIGGRDALPGYTALLLVKPGSLIRP